MKNYLLLFISLIIASYGGYSQPADKITVADKTTEKVIIDGKLDENIWQVQSTITDFIEFYPDNGTAPSEKTQAWLYYDDYGLYLGVKCVDRNKDSILTGLGVRDSGAGTHHDAVGVWFSPYNDKTNCFYFVVSASNVQTDKLISANGEDESWDAVWYSATSINDNGWSVEIKIPYSALRFSKKEVQDWGFNVCRWIARKQEWSSWNYISNEIDNWWSETGVAQGFRDLKPPVRLSLTPYVSGYMEKNTGESESFSYNVGMDLKYGLSQSFTLDMTLIPDFGQVQSDDVELNLSPYELYFNEKRQFFTEGMDLFKKGDIFYSRRIGDKPQNYSNVEDDLLINEEISKNPIETQLINSTKISGRTKSGLGIGVLNAMTQKSMAEIRDTLNHTIRDVQTQPFTNYNVTVVDQTLFSKSYISLINTNYYNTDYLANVTATEINLIDSKNIYGFKVIGGYSYLEGNDITHGSKASFEGGKIGGKVQAIYAMSFIDDKYNQNSLGYMTNNNEFNNNLGISYNLMKPFSVFLSLSNKINFFYNRLYKPNAYSNFYVSYEVNGEFRNRYTFKMHARLAPVESNDYYSTRTDGRYIQLGKYYHNCFYLVSDQSKMISSSIFGGYTAAYNYMIENDSYDFAITPRFKINTKLELIYDLYISVQRNNPNYIEPDFETSNIYFGRMDRETVHNSIKAAYVFTNTMSVDLKLRHYWSAVKYDKFYELDNDGVLQNTTYSGDHNINYNAFNLDMVYRWNFAPGSEILVSWKCAIASEEDEVQNNYWRNAETLFDYSQQNSVSVKLLYYLDYHSLKSKL